jgi:hypothetical protein
VTNSEKTPSALSGTAAITSSDPLLAPLVFDGPGLWDGPRLKKRARWF